MQSDDTQNAGFSESMVEPWLKPPLNYKMKNVKQYKNEPSSLFNVYKTQPIHGNENNVFTEGDIELIFNSGTCDSLICI